MQPAITGILLSDIEVNGGADFFKCNGQLVLDGFFRNL